YLRQSQSPYNTLSEVRYVRLSNRSSEINELFTAMDSEDDAVLIIEAEHPNPSFWLDNLSLQEVAASMADPDDHILFNYNFSPSTKILSLWGTYVDLQNKPHSGSTSVPPFSSVILVK